MLYHMFPTSTISMMLCLAMLYHIHDAVPCNALPYFVLCVCVCVCVEQGKDTKKVKLTEMGDVLEVDEEDLEKVGHVTIM